MVQPMPMSGFTSMRIQNDATLDPCYVESASGFLFGLCLFDSVADTCNYFEAETLSG